MPGMIQPERTLVFREDGTCEATVQSLFSGRSHTLTLCMTQAQYDAWQDGEYVHDAMPDLSAGEREFLMSGATPQEWTHVFSEDHIEKQ